MYFISITERYCFLNLNKKDMTRINLIVPKKLTDQHLIAEIKEINQLAGLFRKSLNSKNGINLESLPVYFSLGKGHVKWFYSRGKYLMSRFYALKEEATIRGFQIKTDFNNEWIKNNRLDLFNDWEPNENDFSLINERIKVKIEKKPDYYRYYKKPLRTCIFN